MKLLADLIDNVLKSNGALSDINPGVRTELEAAAATCKVAWRGPGKPSAEYAEAVLKKAVDDVWACCARCESPIEKLIVPWLIFQDYQLTDSYRPAVLHQDGATNLAPYFIEPQFTLGGSRFDFVLGVRTSRGGAMLAVECDGKAYHDNIKDFYRDKSWRMAGLPTFRLTGGEIHSSPQRAAMKVARALHDHALKEGIL